MDSKANGGVGSGSLGWSPKTEAEREAIREQIGRILGSSLFRNSKRLSSLLRYTAEHALKPNCEPFKERTLGVEVFGREPSYDTAQDPVVRMTAVEIRKRLAQYYQAPEHEHEIRVEFPPGAYLPEFHLPPPEPLEVAENQSDKPAEPRADRRWLVFAALASCAVLIALGSWRFLARETYLDRFWQPIFSTSAPVLLCLGDDKTLPDLANTSQPASDGPVTPETTVLDLLRRDTVRYSNALTMSMFTGYLRAKDKAYHVRRTGNTLLQDLRDGPVVLIGLADNAWTLRLGEQLRFSFARDGEAFYIKDRQNPSNRRWGYDGLNTAVGKISEAQGIISRVLDPTTGRTVVTAAGLIWGTRAAGECLTEPGCLEEAAKFAPGDWRHKNIQIVVSTKVIGENSGPPQVLAAYLW